VDFVLVQLLTGLASAASLFLVASGLTVIFGVTRVVNFAHGSLCMLGAYIGWSVLRRLPPDPGWFAVGLLAAALATGAIGLAMEVLLLRRVYRAPELLQLLLTFAVLLILQDLTQLVWGAADLTLPRPPWLRAFVRIGEARISRYDLQLIAIGPAVLGLLWLLMRRTRFGMLVRAATENRQMVAALGVNEKILFSAVFALGSALAGLGGALSLPGGSANLQIDLSVVVEAFVVVVVGGMGSLPGAFLAAVLIGVLQAFGIVLLPKITLVLVFSVMAVVLAMRPQGLLGRQEASAAPAEIFTLVRPASSPARWLGLAALVLAVGAPLFVGPFWVSVLTEAAISVLFAASLHFAMGPGGMPSFGHAAWFGIGAYAAGLSLRFFDAPMAAGIALAPVAAGVVAVLFAGCVVRLSGVYLAMLTLAFAQIVWAGASQLVDITGGDNGILGLRPADWARDPVVFYWLALALCVGPALLLRRILFAPFGYALRAVRDRPLRAEAIGLDAMRLRLVALTISGAAAGLSGGVFAYAKGSVFPTYISMGKSVDALLMVLLGGVQTMAGPVVGAVAYTGLFDALLLATDFWRLSLGVGIIALVLLFPAGIAGTAARLR
jgi:branched-chain amino acid transport system permease protein